MIDTASYIPFIISDNQQLLFINLWVMCTYKTKENIKSIAVNEIEYYRLLMQRFARFIVKDESVAEWLVQQALQDKHYRKGFKSLAYLRRTLKQNVWLRCIYHKQAQIFDRPPIKVRMRSYT
jgi:hypothetical protein